MPYHHVVEFGFFELWKQATKHKMQGYAKMPQ
jgi:hypothetical protein